MMARFISWISMVFLASFTTRSVIGQGNRPMCYTTVNQIVNLTTHRDQRKTACCSGFANKSGICACSIGWGGVSCNEPLLCRITETDQVNHLGAVSEDPSVKSAEEATDNSVRDLNKYVDECLPGCLSQLNSTILRGQSANTNYYFVDKHLLCNIVPVHQTFWRMYIIGSIIVVGVILFLLLIIEIVYIVRKKRRAKGTRNVSNEPMELIHNDNSWQHCDDVVPAETHTYDDIRILPNRIYDDVIVGSPPVHTYDNVHVQSAISDYDDVYFAPISDNDYVNIEPIQNSLSRPNPRMATIGTASRMKKS